MGSYLGDLARARNALKRELGWVVTTDYRRDGDDVAWVAGGGKSGSYSALNCACPRAVTPGGGGDMDAYIEHEYESARKAAEVMFKAGLQVFSSVEFYGGSSRPSRHPGQVCIIHNEDKFLKGIKR